jgi:hypothetical protein
MPILTFSKPCAVTNSPRDSVITRPKTNRNVAPGLVKAETRLLRPSFRRCRGVFALGLWMPAFNGIEAFFPMFFGITDETVSRGNPIKIFA